MRFLARLLPVFLLFIFFLFGQAVRADNLVITSGMMQHENPAFAARSGYVFNVAGEGFAAGAIGEKMGSVHSVNCSFCAPGQTYNAQFTINQFSGNELVGSYLTLDGTTRSPIWFVGSSLNIVLAPVVMPPIGFPTTQTVTTAFTFDGTLSGQTPPSVNPPFTFSHTISGQGLATLTLELRQNGLNTYFWVPIRFNYQFQPAAPVPEPATLVLLGTGLAGIAARRRRRRA